MKNRTYVVRYYITVSEEEALDYIIASKGCENEDNFKMEYNVTNEDWKDCALEKWDNDDYNYGGIELLKETEE